jgi:superfamily II DNA or RNA helicase
MQLRQWQHECLTRALQQYSTGQSHFLCLATPGAGKTYMASILAKQLLEANEIDFIFCFSPSLIVSTDFQAEIENQTGRRLDGKLGAHGCSITYQGMLTLGQEFWQLFDQYRVFVIFDEIHHCAGSDFHNANAWGQIILSKIQDRAAYTLALSGTPWRSDNIPIALSRYRLEDNNIHCDYEYGLSKAISDGVCRTPRLILIDNDHIQLHSKDETREYRSFSELLEQTQCSYQQIIENDELITYTLQQASEKLDRFRQTVADAGGLIVAASVSHARKIKSILQYELDEHAAIATYQEDDALTIIQDFRYSKSKWIISVGMISEGTNIPRLRVCCHLSRVKTELYFRQILGRILRATRQGEEGFLYMPAEPSLIKYAYQLAEDIPASNVVNTEKMNVHGGKSIKNRLTRTDRLPIDFVFKGTQNHVVQSEQEFLLNPFSKSSLADTYERTIGVFGRFKEELVTISSNF